MGDQLSPKWQAWEDYQARLRELGYKDDQLILVVVGFSEGWNQCEEQEQG